MVVTFVTSIPAYFILYAPVRDNPDYITGAGADPTASVALGAVLELILIIANVGTAVVPYAVFRRYSEGLALGYIAVMFDVIERGSVPQGVATIPEFIWELSLGIYLIVKGF
jgi:hypothetical protein